MKLIAEDEGVAVVESRKKEGEKVVMVMLVVVIVVLVIGQSRARPNRGKTGERGGCNGVIS